MTQGQEQVRKSRRDVDHFAHHRRHLRRCGNLRRVELTGCDSHGHRNPNPNSDAQHTDFDADGHPSPHPYAAADTDHHLHADDRHHHFDCRNARGSSRRGGDAFGRSSEIHRLVLIRTDARECMRLINVSGERRPPQPSEFLSPAICLEALRFGFQSPQSE